MSSASIRDIRHKCHKEKLVKYVTYLPTAKIQSFCKS